jgi:hypothetical protein
MAINQTQTTSFKKQLYEAGHNLLTDNLYMALYVAAADLNQDTLIYTTQNEVTGGGYTAGGVLLTGVTINSSGYTAYVSFNAVDFNASVTARGALIYNASKGNKSIAVLDFGSDKTSTDFIVTPPTNTATSAIIRSSN